MDDAEVVQQSSKHPFGIVGMEDDYPGYEIDNQDDDGTTSYVSVVEVTSKYLGKIKETAEYFLGQKVSGCVISIPAHFEQAQKDALIAATTTAGFHAAYPIHEPVAAALAFEAQDQQTGINNKNDSLMLVLDLGAHQFNVTLLSRHDGLFTIESSVEESDLGGIAFTELLVGFVAQEFKRKSKVTISDNRRAMQKLRNACERTKRALTRQETAPCSVESLYDGMDYHATINRGRFEMLCDPLYVRCKETVMRVLKENGARPQDVSQVLVIGGASRMPRFEATMKPLFPASVAFKTNVEPDEAISIGCAEQARIITECNLDDYDALANDAQVVNADHITKSIGLGVSSDQYVIAIPHGTPIPVQRKFSFATSSQEAYFAVYEGNDTSSAKKNHLLAEVVLSELNASESIVEIVLTIESNCVLNVVASEQTSGQRVTVNIK